MKKLNENKNLKPKNLIIIHNLQTYETKKQVEKYIEEFIMKSATFKVVKDESNNSQDNIEYFFDSENDYIKHFLYAKENSEAGEYYNKRTINAILNMYYIETTKFHYDYKQTISDHFKYMGGLMFETGNIPCFGYSFDWWKEKAENYLSERGSRLGTPKEYVAYLGVLIKKLVSEKSFSKNEFTT